MLSNYAFRVAKQPLRTVSTVVFKQVGPSRFMVTKASQDGHKGMEIQKRGGGGGEFPGLDIFRRRGRGGGLWHELEDMHNTMDKMMDMMMGQGFGDQGLMARTGGMQVSVDIEETDDAFILKADVPGISKEDIKVQVTDEGNLTISGERKIQQVEEKGGFWRAERAYGNFSRSFKFPKAIKTDGISAKYENGELTLTVPKAHPEKTVTKDITIE